MWAKKSPLTYKNEAQTFEYKMCASSIQYSIYPSIVIFTDQVKDSFKVNSIPQVFLKWFYFLFVFREKAKITSFLAI